MPWSKTQAAQTTTTLGLERMPWSYYTQQHKEPTEQESCACEASFWPWLYQPSGCLPSCMQCFQVILTETRSRLVLSPTLHLVASSSPHLFVDSKSSLLLHPFCLKRCNYIRRLKLLSTITSDFVSIALHSTAPLCPLNAATAHLSGELVYCKLKDNQPLHPKIKVG